MTIHEPPGLLVVLTDIAPEQEAEFNRWYDTRHLPQLLSVPGFAAGRRYRCVEGIDGTRKYLALYDLERYDVLKSDAMLAVARPPQRTDEDREMIRRFQRALRADMTQIYPAAGKTPPPPPNSGAMLVVGLVPEPEYEEEYNAWYDEEHIPGLLPVPGVLRARRFRAVEGAPRYLAIYELSAAEVRHSAAFEKAIDTPWSTRLRRHLARPVTGIYVPLETSHQPSAISSQPVT